MGISEDIKEIKDKLVEKEKEGLVKEKKWKFPFGKKVGRGQKKKNYVTVLLVNENGIYDFKKYQIEDQTIIHDLIPRIATTDYVMFDKKGNPMIVLMNWSIEPLNPKQHLKDSLANGTNTVGFKILMDKMLKTQVSAKAKMGGWVKWVIGLGLAAIIGYALITGGGG